MTPEEIATRLTALKVRVKPHYVGIHFSTDRTVFAGRPLFGTLSLPGAKNSTLSSDSFEDLLTRLEEAVEAALIPMQKVRTRAMALKIIEITADNSICTIAALKSAGFTEVEISNLGEAACVEANTLAGKGEFKIEQETA